MIFVVYVKNVNMSKARDKEEWNPICCLEHLLYLVRVLESDNDQKMILRLSKIIVVCVKNVSMAKAQDNEEGTHLVNR